MFSIREPAVGTVPRPLSDTHRDYLRREDHRRQASSVTRHVAGFRCDLTILSKVVALINTTRV